jgi:hypothetical protein
MKMIPAPAPGLSLAQEWSRHHLPLLDYGIFNLGDPIIAEWAAGFGASIEELAEGNFLVHVSLHPDKERHLISF